VKGKSKKDEVYLTIPGTGRKKERKKEKKTTGDERGLSNCTRDRGSPCMTRKKRRKKKEGKRRKKKTSIIACAR